MIILGRVLGTELKTTTRDYNFLFVIAESRKTVSPAKQIFIRVCHRNGVYQSKDEWRKVPPWPPAALLSFESARANRERTGRENESIDSPPSFALLSCFQEKSAEESTGAPPKGNENPFTIQTSRDRVPAAVTSLSISHYFVQTLISTSRNLFWFSLLEIASPCQ